MARIIISNSLNPYENLGLEEYLLQNHDGMPLLYLWQNKKTVVIGKYQNAFEECNLEVMKELEVTLARRITGGGAVYHHTGNLNFSFILSNEQYDTNRQLQVIINALKTIGIDAYFSGRNDILVSEKKFSGNAFYNGEQSSLHHGTILISENKDLIEKVLNVKDAKLISKGVKSIKSRIINLNEINPKLTPSIISDLLIKSFEVEYGKATFLSVDSNLFKKNSLKFSSNDWLYGKNPTYNKIIHGRTVYGNLDVYLLLKDNIIKSATVYTDSLLPDLSTKLEYALNGVYFSISGILNLILDEKFDKNEFVSFFFPKD